MTAVLGNALDVGLDTETRVFRQSHLAAVDLADGAAAGLAERVGI